MQEAASASYSLLRGFLNALASDDPECANKFMCEGAKEAAAAGPLGEVVARVARYVANTSAAAVVMCSRDPEHNGA